MPGGDVNVNDGGTGLRQTLGFFANAIAGALIQDDGGNSYAIDYTDRDPDGSNTAAFNYVSLTVIAAVPKPAFGGLVLLAPVALRRRRRGA